MKHANRLAAAVVGLVLLTGGCNKSDPPSTPRPAATETRRYPAQQFNSKVRFDVMVRTLEQPGPDLDGFTGQTPSEKPVEIPACERWWVQPKVFDEAAAAEIKARNLPGLFLNGDTGDAALPLLDGLTGLQSLELAGCHWISDTGLEHVKGLTGLLSLNLENVGVTDAGLENLKGLTGLQVLNLENTKITDAGLPYLDGMTGLHSLNLSHTQVTDAGLEHVKRLTELQSLFLAETQVTDAGLEQLTGLKGLKYLTRWDTKVTDAGKAKLKAALPNVEIK